MTSLYALSHDFAKSLDQLFDPETGEALPAFEELRGQLATKGASVAAYLLDVEADASKAQAAINRIKELQAAYERKAQRLREYLADSMKTAGISEIKGDAFVVKLYPGRDESVEIDADAVFDASLCADPKPPAPSKAKIKAAILAGQPIAGARIVRKDRLTIK
jgi:hypothetical protein